MEGPARLRRQRPVSSPSTTSTEEGAAFSVFPFGNCVFVYFVFVRVRRRWVGIRLCGCEDLVGMTVLEEARMSGSLGGDRYITPEYLAPLPQVSTISKKCILLNFQKVISSNCNRYLTMTTSCCCSAKYLLWFFYQVDKIWIAMIFAQIPIFKMCEVFMTNVVKAMRTKKHTCNPIRHVLLAFSIHFLGNNLWQNHCFAQWRNLQRWFTCRHMTPCVHSMMCGVEYMIHILYFYVKVY